jgi:hypothetical protein
MVSILREGATRWFERGLVPYGEREFLLPSGNYTMRIYDGAWNELHNDSYVMDRSMVYVIQGSNLSVVISGQSVITGQLLELSSDLYDATAPDVIQVCYNIPGIYSVYDRKGAIISTRLVCPALIYTADTINETETGPEGNMIRPLKPGSDSDNGTITVMDDIMYFQGNASAVTWVNVDVEGTATNYSYLPNNIILYGENVTVTANTEIYIKRVTRYQSLKKFQWTEYTFTESSDVPYYTTTVGFTNPFLNRTIRQVYSYIEYYNDSEPNQMTTRVFDVSNNVYLTQGENFKVSGSGIEFQMASISANDTRYFTCSYYGRTTAQVTSSRIVTVKDYGYKTYDNENYYHFLAEWVNTGSTNFIGTLTIALAFDTYPYEISARSILVFDRENNGWLDKDDGDFSFNGHSILISQDTLGTVSPNVGRSFEVYFQFTSEENIVDQAQSLLDSKIFGFPLAWLIIGIFLLLAAVISKAEKDRNKKPWLGVMFVLFAVFTFFYWMGVS